MIEKKKRVEKRLKPIQRKLIKRWMIDQLNPMDSEERINFKFKENRNKLTSDDVPTNVLAEVENIKDYEELYDDIDEFMIEVTEGLKEDYRGVAIKSTKFIFE